MQPLAKRHMPIRGNKKIITDNDIQFISLKFQDFYKELRIEFLYSSLSYPQTNRLINLTKKTIIGTIKKNLGEQKISWVEDLPNILCTYRTMTGNTPFLLSYGAKVVSLFEIEARRQCSKVMKLEETSTWTPSMKYRTRH